MVRTLVLRNLPWHFTRGDVVRAVQRNFDVKNVRDAFITYDKNTGLSKCLAVVHVDNEVATQMLRKGLFEADDRPVYIEPARSTNRQKY